MIIFISGGTCFCGVLLVWDIFLVNFLNAIRNRSTIITTSPLRQHQYNGTLVSSTKQEKFNDLQQ